jgi:hypothetical protein
LAFVKCGGTYCLVVSRATRSVRKRAGKHRTWQRERAAPRQEARATLPRAPPSCRAWSREQRAPPSACFASTSHSSSAFEHSALLLRPPRRPVVLSPRTLARAPRPSPTDARAAPSSRDRPPPRATDARSGRASGASSWRADAGARDLVTSRAREREATPQRDAALTCSRSAPRRPRP